MKIWMVAREYAGLAESGGVKNVVCSLSEALVQLGHDVTCFIPFYGCVNTQSLSFFRKDELFSSVFSAKENYGVTYSFGILNKVKIVLIGAGCFGEKQNVYTYCFADKENFPECKIGVGYSDNHLMNTVFQKAILNYGEEFCSQKESPDVIHCHDACTAALPAIIKNLKNSGFEKTKFVVSIHNAGPAYHHDFNDLNEAAFYTTLPQEVLERAKNKERIEPYLLAAECAALSTVSPWYAQELLDKNNTNTDGLSQIFAERGTKICGITNGIDLARYTPEDNSVSLLPFAFSPEKLKLEGKYKTREHFIKGQYSEFSSERRAEWPLARSGFLDGNGKVYFSYHGRLVRQKGVFVMLEAAQEVLQKNPDVRFIINGQGEEELRSRCAEFAQKNQGRVVFFCGYERALCRLFTASSDFALMPSDFEPCGMEDFIAQIFGTIPVAHATGGLKKIIDGKTGFLYQPNTAQRLAQTMLELAQKKINGDEELNGIIKNAAKHVREHCTWKNVAMEYEKLYGE